MTRLKRLFSWLASLLLLYHVCAVFATVLPNNSALYAAFYPCFRHYWQITGNWQSWTMFRTIPYDRGYDVQVTVYDANDRERECGFIVPGFDEDNGRLRLYKLLSSYHKKHYEDYREPYLENLGRAIQADFPSATRYTVRVTTHRLRGLQEMRDNGKVSTAGETIYGPFKID